ncbi:HlyD family secretion protein [Xanthobacteraceae bacterium A53D]
MAETPEPQASDAAPPRPRRTLRRWVIIALLLGGLVYFGGDSIIAYTDDAYVRSDFVPIAPEVSGIVRKVEVSDNQRVSAGTPLVEIDPEPYRLAVALKDAQIADAQADAAQKTAGIAVLEEAAEAARARLLLAQQEFNRVAPLVKEEDLSQAELDSATDALRTAQANLAEAQASVAVGRREVASAAGAVETAKAERAVAAYALARTKIAAPLDGYVTNLTLRPGAYAKEGEALIGLVDAHQFRITANFKEYIAAALPKDKTVWIWLDSHPWRLFKGRVESVGRGIARDKDGGALLPYVAPTTNWIRLLRRLPVTIVFDPSVPESDLFMGADARVLIFR